MTIPVIGDNTSALNVSLTRGQAKDITFTSAVDLPEGTYTAQAHGTSLDIDQPDARTLVVSFPADNAALLWEPWRVLYDGVDFAGATVVETLPNHQAGTTEQALVVNLGDTVVNLAVTLVGGGHSTAWTSLLPASLDGVAGWIDPLDLVGSSNPAYIPRCLSVRLLADGRVQLEGLALYVDSSGSPDVPPAASTIATLASGFHPLTRPPFVTALETSFGDGSLSQASASVSLTGEVKAPQAPTSPLLAITSTYDPA